MTIQELQKQHRAAQDSRRALETELRELPSKLDYALSMAEVDTIQKLNKRRAELPAELQLASSIEHARYGQFVKAQTKYESELEAEAQQQVDEIEDRLLRRRKEWAAEEAGLLQALEKAQIRRNSHTREVEVWGVRFGTADARYRAAVAEQQAA